MKNIVVLKNLPSNIVDEAIVVLKANKKAKKFQYSQNEEDKTNIFREVKDIDDKNYIVKEAEYLISDYIEKIESQDLKESKKMNEIKIKYAKLKKINIVLMISLIITTAICIF